jgi:hypothetical protein
MVTVTTLKQLTDAIKGTVAITCPFDFRLATPIFDISIINTTQKFKRET